MAVKTYGIHDQWTDLNKLNIVEIKSENGVVESVKINGEDSGGGGGESDFSTAEVSVVINTEDEFISNLMMVIILEENRMQTAFALNQGTFTVPLFKGSLYTVYAGLNPAKLTVTGDAEYDSEHGDLTITGNCTITLNP